MEYNFFIFKVYKSSGLESDFNLHARVLSLFRTGSMDVERFRHAWGVVNKIFSAGREVESLTSVNFLFLSYKNRNVERFKTKVTMKIYSCMEIENSLKETTYNTGYNTTIKK